MPKRVTEIPHADSPETAHTRARHSALKRRVFWTAAIWLISGLMSRFLDWWDEDAILLRFSGPVFFVATPTLIMSAVKMWRAEAAVNHQVRRELAAQKKSPEAAFAPIVPPHYIPKQVRSAETSRLIAQGLRRLIPLQLMGSAFLGMWGLSVAGAGDDIAFFAGSVIGVALIFVVNRDLFVQIARSQDHDRDTYRPSRIAAMTPAGTAPVLYLRSFTDDDAAGQRYGKLTEEEQLAKALAWFGPLLAVGRPGERLPQVGAQRIYLADDVWQVRVAELMTTARLVVIRTGASQGFRWEVSQALSTIAPERLLLVVDDRDEFRLVVNHIGEYVDRRIPRVRLWGPPIGTVRGLVMFGASWSPQALPLHFGLLRARDEDGTLVSRFVLSLSPLFERHGVFYKAPPWGGPVLALLALLAILVVPALIADYFFD